MCSHNVENKEIGISMCGGKEWKRLEQMSDVVGLFMSIN